MARMTGCQQSRGRPSRTPPQALHIRLFRPLDEYIFIA
ncbi:hypothetical protein CYFUS_003787 [Cystobacter fuscus]|uniref:Uncharacterized protein n=1 Tax=Cystobacter fuscus TaxID=43 RepID=A0A250J445_9BACT|nr:hypothetical protein CYFUS_003787 [Cystobacter fuscus]